MIKAVNLIVICYQSFKFSADQGDISHTALLVHFPIKARLNVITFKLADKKQTTGM